MLSIFSIVIKHRTILKYINMFLFNMFRKRSMLYGSSHHAGGELHKFVLYYMKKENIVELLLIFFFFFFSFFVLCRQQRRGREISIGIRKEVSDLFFPLNLFYHEWYHRSKQKTVYELDS